MSFYYEDMHLTITDNNGNNSLINFNNIIEDDISPEMGARFQVLSDEIVAKIDAMDDSHFFENMEN